MRRILRCLLQYRWVADKMPVRHSRIRTPVAGGPVAVVPGWCGDEGTFISRSALCGAGPGDWQRPAENRQRLRMVAWKRRCTVATAGRRMDSKPDGARIW